MVHVDAREGLKECCICSNVSSSQIVRARTNFVACPSMLHELVLAPEVCIAMIVEGANHSSKGLPRYTP